MDSLLHNIDRLEHENSYLRQLGDEETKAVKLDGEIKTCKESYAIIVEIAQVDDHRGHEGSHDKS